MNTGTVHERSKELPACSGGCSEFGRAVDVAHGHLERALDAVLFVPTTVDAGNRLTVSAPVGEDELKSDISVYVAGSEDATIHTSCSQPLGVGDTFGSFTVIVGRDKAGRLLCDT